ncbi:MAG: aquaporin [Candidatus Latescibacteria bacterium]|nr:aquaporin [Candidatus Latescibacterota bacterium]
MNTPLKSVLAELIGTFTLVFIGAGAGALAGINGGGILSVALAHGVALMVIVYAWGSTSGAHVNPAVTFGLALVGNINWGKAIGYWVAQFVGAAIAGYLLLYLVDAETGLGATTGSLTMSDPLKTIVVEAVLTFFLVTAVFGSAVAGRNGNAVGLAIGLVLTMDILMGGSLTGASMNPARTFGPALATADFSYLWMYFVGPLLGGGVAAIVYNRVLK